jgi:hypothetical protein
MDVEAVPHDSVQPLEIGRRNAPNYPRDAAEMALAHAIGDKVEAAYRRGNLFEKRVLMMADWAKFCAIAKTGTESVMARAS